MTAFFFINASSQRTLSNSTKLSSRAQRGTFPRCLSESALPERSLESARQLHAQEDAELTGEVAADAGVDAALLVEEAAVVPDRKHAFVPDLGMDVDAEAAVGPEGEKILGLQVVARPGHRHDEGLAVERPEELAAVGMVVAMPQEHAALVQRHAFGCTLRQVAEADDVMAAHRLVAAEQLVAAPFAGEDAFGRARLVAGAGVELPPAAGRPGHDLDAVRVRIVHDLAIAFQRLPGGANDRRFDEAQAGGHGRVEVIEDRLVHGQAALPRSSPASARSIRRTTLSRPNSFMKAPMRGPCSLPKSTSYKVLNHWRSSSLAKWRLPVS